MGLTIKAFKACIFCLGETDSIYLKNCQKVVYMGHRRFLLTNDKLRTNRKHFNGKLDHRVKPTHRNGTRVFAMVKDLKVVFGKGPSSQPILNEDGKAAMWKKKSIF